jgi:hypothetical protein
MAFAVAWDVLGTHTFERGLDRGMLYLQQSSGLYSDGVSWSGLTSVSLSQNNTGFEPIYYDGYKITDVFNKSYVSGTISAFSYPDLMTYAEGGDDQTNFITINGQNFSRFAMSYRTQNSHDLNESAGYKIHILYNMVAQRTSRDFATINDSSNAYEFTWDFSCTPAFAGATLKPTSHVVIDTRKVSAGNVTLVENNLYGVAGVSPANVPTIPTLIGFNS